MPATSSIRVQTLDHVTIVVKDLERSRQFYCDVLGMEEQDRPNFAFQGSWFQAGDTQIHTILEFEDSGPAGDDGKKSTRAHHFAFRVDDAKAAAEHLKACGVPFVAGPKERPDGAVQTFVTDPDGYIIELCSTP
ncbi:VOC family protein [Thalassoroseus pseudoceratinae]|uniref:VOC family protein n=1 Tax=Thalassoroseus pseudoceratinae TaxID=2713176 RepID=UPI00197F22CC|nr:VOC family protein [Thalassoroseus pseudoceratinae]